MSEQEIETQDLEIETPPEASGLVNTTQESIDSMLTLADNIDRMIDAQNRIRTAVMKLAQPGDWVLFKGQEGDPGKAEIGFAGSMRIGSTLGVSFTNWEAKKEIGRDELGEWYRWEFECDAAYRGRIIRVYGRAGSRDKFFGKAKGQYKLIHELDEGNIKIAARRAAMKEGVKVMFGLHHMDPVFIQKQGVVLSSAGGYEFKKTAPDGQAAPAAAGNGASKFGGEGKISEAQGKRLYAIMKGSGKTEEQVKGYLKEMYGIEHSYEINRKDYEAICNWVEKGEAPKA